ncbi:hypothetical protein [Delftia acidovorans]|uniref:hypothetical protein n=1 Tax=Delftia acidovorans TaxID=80866 RepID=UPI00242DA2FD|nr:hypothetical protein [Delftia acidovorans]
MKISKKDRKDALQDSCLYASSSWLFSLISKLKIFLVAVELVGESMRGGKLKELSTASMLLCNVYRP